MILCLNSFFMPNVIVLEDLINIDPKSSFTGNAYIFCNYSPVNSFLFLFLKFTYIFFIEPDEHALISA